MAEAKGSNFLLLYGEKVLVAVLAAACAAYAVWTFLNLTPANIADLDKARQALSAQVAKLPPQSPVQWPRPQIQEQWKKQPELQTIDLDPFQRPKTTAASRAYTLKPGALLTLSEHVKYLVPPYKSVRIEPEATAQRLPEPRVGADYKVTVDGTALSPLVDERAELSIVDANNNSFLYRLRVGGEPPPELHPPKLVDVQAERRKATLQWEENPNTSAPIMGWLIERRTGDGPFQPIKQIDRVLGPSVDPSSRPPLSEYRYVDETVEPSTTYSYQVSTRAQVGTVVESSKPSDPQTVTTKSDLAIALVNVSESLATIRVSKWVKDIEVAYAFPVRPGQRIGYDPHRSFPKVGGPVDFTTPYFLVDIQPVRLLKKVVRKVSVADETGKTYLKEIEIIWYENTHQVIVYHEDKKFHEIYRLGGLVPTGR